VKAAGVDGLLTLDLPPEEAADHLAACQQHGVKTVFIVAPTTPDARLETICKAATGFIYYVSREGVTGEQAKLSDGIKARVDTIKKHTDLPVVVGFGISNAGHVNTVAQAADGVVVGSALVNCIANNLGNADLIYEALRSKMQELTQEDSLDKLA
jgi:tryptophan synthase alpha chain